MFVGRSGGRGREGKGEGGRGGAAVGAEKDGRSRKDPKQGVRIYTNALCIAVVKLSCIVRDSLETD